MTILVKYGHPNQNTMYDECFTEQLQTWPLNGTKLNFTFLTMQSEILFLIFFFY